MDTNVEYISDLGVFGREVYESTKNPKNEAVLRVVKGPIAEYGKLNRNNRKYSEKLWDRVLESPYVKEQLKFHTLYGECNHPESRYEVDFERVSHSIVEMWKVPSSSQIWGTVYILDTPFGRILNTLYEAGGIIGYSTRAGGVLNKRKDYVEVDENTYNFITLDAVPYPSVESARPETVCEGVVEKVALSQECHDNLFKIINESSSREREMIKDFIYSLQSFDFSKEISLLEGFSQGKSKLLNVSADSVEETTKFLLKDNAVQIESLKADNATLKATNESITKENISLKSSLESSLRKVSNLIESMKAYETASEKRTNSKVDELTNTIRDLNNRISKLVLEADEREFELENLKDAYEAYCITKDENVGLKAQLVNADESVATSRELRQNSELELEDAYEEVTKMVKEIATLNESLKDRESKILSLEGKLDESNTRISNLENSLKEVRIAENAEISSDLEQKNQKLKAEIAQITEGAKEKDAYMSVLKKELVSVICSNYGVSNESVMNKLPVGFTKSDIYAVCESMHNSNRTTAPKVSLVDVVRQKPTSKSGGTHKSTISEAFSSNRRGVGII